MVKLLCNTYVHIPTMHGWVLSSSNLIHTWHHCIYIVTYCIWFWVWNVILCSTYCTVGFCHQEFNDASHRILNIKTHYIFHLMTFHHVRFCNCLVLYLYFSISLRSKWGLFQTLKEHYLMHESTQNSSNWHLIKVITCRDLIIAKDTIRENWCRYILFSWLILSATKTRYMVFLI